MMDISDLEASIAHGDQPAKQLAICFALLHEDYVRWIKNSSMQRYITANSRYLCDRLDQDGPFKGISP